MYICSISLCVQETSPLILLYYTQCYFLWKFRERFQNFFSLCLFQYIREFICSFTALSIPIIFHIYIIPNVCCQSVFSLYSFLKSFLYFSRSRRIWGGRVRTQFAGLYLTTAQCARRVARGARRCQRVWSDTNQMGGDGAPALAIIFHFRLWFLLML